MCASLIAAPIKVSVQADGRIRNWGFVTLLGESEARVLRGVTLADGETVHNAFVDRDYCEDVS